MLDIKFLRTNPDVVKENIKKKFQDDKLPLVDEVIDFDEKFRAAKTRCDELRALRNSKSKMIGGLMAKGQKEEAEKVKEEVKAFGAELEALEVKETEYEAEIRKSAAGIYRDFDAGVSFVWGKCGEGRVRQFMRTVVSVVVIPSAGERSANDIQVSIGRTNTEKADGRTAVAITKKIAGEGVGSAGLLQRDIGR